MIATVKVKVAKNKVAPPFRIAEFDIIFGQGISRLGCLLDLAEKTEVVTRRGAWYSYKGDNIAQGRDNAVSYLEQNSEMAQEVEQEVKSKLDINSLVASDSDDDIDDTSMDFAEEEI